MIITSCWPVNGTIKTIKIMIDLLFYRNFILLTTISGTLFWHVLKLRSLKMWINDNTALHYTIALLSYEDLTATHSGPCADDLYRLPIKSQLTRFRKWKALKVACMKYFDWLVNFPEMEITKVVCQIFIR